MNTKSITHASTAKAALPPNRSGWRLPEGSFLGLVLASLTLSWVYANQSQLATLLSWTPALLKGFGVNIGIGLVAVALATIGGTLLGIAQISPWAPLARSARTLTLALRNAPWLVIMFAMMAGIPFEIEIFDHYFQPSDWVKVAVGLALGGCGYMSEIVRGGIRSIPSSQWEAAASLALNRRQMLVKVILPQALRSMTPAWMNLYCTMTMATSLANLLGINDLMTVMQEQLAAQAQPDLLLPAYGLVFLIYFVYIYPLSRYSRWLEKRWSIYG